MGKFADAIAADINAGASPRPSMESKMPKAKYSEKDSRGALFVDCSECDRGGNGGDQDKCSAGHRHKRGRKGGCFSGKLVDGLVL